MKESHNNSMSSIRASPFAQVGSDWFGTDVAPIFIDARRVQKHKFTEQILQGFLSPCDIEKYASAPMPSTRPHHRLQPTSTLIKKTVRFSPMPPTLHVFTDYDDEDRSSMPRQSMYYDHDHDHDHDLRQIPFGTPDATRIL